MPSYFNIFECVMNLLNRHEVTYEQECMATTRKKNQTKMLETLVDYNDCINAPFFNEKLRQAFSKVMVEAEEEDVTPNVMSIIGLKILFFISPLSRPINKEILLT